MATEADLTFTLSDDGTYYSVGATDASTISGELVIPAEHEGLPVKRIPDWGDGFSRCTGITSVVFPEVEGFLVGYCSFNSCTGLTSLVFPANYEFGPSPFTRCTNLSYVKIKGNAIVDPEIHDMGEGTFYNTKVSAVYVEAGTTGWGETWGGVPVVKVSTPGVYFGSRYLVGMKIGDADVNKAYLGDTAVYEANS